MHAVSTAAVPPASKSAASFSREILKIESVPNVGKKLPGYNFGRMCSALWPRKTPASIEYFTGMPDRTARHVATGKSDPGSAFLAKIIDSDQGWRALEWIMRDSQQAWWRDLQRHRKIGSDTERAVSEAQAQFQF